MNYKEIIQWIRPLDKNSMTQAQARVDSLIKPLGSLGLLETLAVQLAGITGKIHNTVDKRGSIIMSADNGICAERVSCTPQDITLIQSINMPRGISGMGTLSRHANSDLFVVDIGIDSDYRDDKILYRKIRRGTANFAKGPAMFREEAEQAIQVGIDMVAQLATEGYQIIGTGEMGIGNTSSSSAVIMTLTGISAQQAVGKGGGLTEEAYENKKRILQEAISLNRPDPLDPIDVLAKVGGLDIAGLTGVFLGAAYYRVPVVIDGVISAAAALVASRLQPLVTGYMIASHISREPAYSLIAQTLGLKPMLAMEMRLGEGTGCALAFPIISAACAMMNQMATFADISYDETYRVDIRDGEQGEQSK